MLILDFRMKKPNTRHENRRPASADRAENQQKLIIDGYWGTSPEQRDFTIAKPCSVYVTHNCDTGTASSQMRYCA